jgi:hypothetical protein
MDFVDYAKLAFNVYAIFELTGNPLPIKDQYKFEGGLTSYLGGTLIGSIIYISPLETIPWLSWTNLSFSPLYNNYLYWAWNYFRYFPRPKRLIQVSNFLFF